MAWHSRSRGGLPTTAGRGQREELVAVLEMSEMKIDVEGIY
jgi:hypothetical protein